jgi:hypothetical protein
MSRMEQATLWAKSAVWVLGSALVALTSFGLGMQVF